LVKKSKYDSLSFNYDEKKEQVIAIMGRLELEQQWARHPSGELSYSTMYKTLEGKLIYKTRVVAEQIKKAEEETQLRQTTQRKLDEIRKQYTSETNALKRELDQVEDVAFNRRCEIERLTKMLKECEEIITLDIMKAEKVLVEAKSPKKAKIDKFTMPTQVGIDRLMNSVSATTKTSTSPA
jgi:hypothetical protein